MKTIRLLFTLLTILLFTACSSEALYVDKVIYRSLRTDYAQPNTSSPIPKEAKIIACYKISEDGLCEVTVVNNTDEIMIIDNTKSYFISGGKSISYYDPTIKTTTKTDLSSATKGMSVNLGAIGSALGVGGPLGQALNGINVGGSGTSGSAIANTTYIADQPQISIGPKGSTQMGHIYPIQGFGNFNVLTKIDYTKDNSVLRFSVCISYSLDDGKTYQKLVTDFHSNATCVIPVQNGKLSNSMQQIMSIKPDAFAEEWWMIKINTNIESDVVYNGLGQSYDWKVFNKCSNGGILFDYQ